ncbi:MAG: hypothetical protein ACYDH5_11200 [Acidimicrobiales bacterium]
MLDYAPIPWQSSRDEYETNAVAAVTHPWAGNGAPWTGNGAPWAGNGADRVVIG